MLIVGKVASDWPPYGGTSAAAVDLRPQEGSRARRIGLVKMIPELPIELPPDEKDALERVVESGSALTGATSGALLGALIAPPVGAPIGAGAGWAVGELAKVGADVARRWLSPRERREWAPSSESPPTRSVREP